MARPATPLTDTRIKNSRAREKMYKLSDGGGLYLSVTPAGGKNWKLRYNKNGKEQTISLGAYPTITLRQARSLREQYKQDIAQGIDPNEVKKEARLQAQQEEIRQQNTFKELALERLAIEEERISRSHYVRTIRGFTNDIFPYIGDTPVDDVTAQDIITLLHRMLERGVQNSAQKVYHSISKTYKWAVANGKATRNPAADMDISEIIGTIRVTNYATVTDEDSIKKLLKAITTLDGELSTKNALRLLAYTCVRPVNVLLAEWSEINIEDKQWVIPKEKMKTKRDHIVPLTETVIGVIEEMRLTATGIYLFPNSRSVNTPMSDGTMRMALRRQGITKHEFTPHGFRAMFSTIAHEKSDFQHEVIEAHLAHSVGSSVSQAYNRALYLQERVQLMEWWSNYLNAIERVSYE